MNFGSSERGGATRRSVVLLSGCLVYRRPQSANDNPDNSLDVVLGVCAWGCCLWRDLLSSPDIILFVTVSSTLFFWFPSVLPPSALFYLVLCNFFVITPVISHHYYVIIHDSLTRKTGVRHHSYFPGARHGSSYALELRCAWVVLILYRIFQLCCQFFWW